MSRQDYDQSDASGPWIDVDKHLYPSGQHLVQRQHHETEVDHRGKPKKRFLQFHLAEELGGGHARFEPGAPDQLELYVRPDARNIIHVEGEDCANFVNKKLKEAGLNSKDWIATTSPGGSKNWRGELAKDYAGKRVYGSPDWQQDGYDYISAVMASSVDHDAAIAKLVEVGGKNPGDDLKDWLSRDGNTIEKWIKLAEASTAWTPNWKPALWESAISLDDFVAYLPEHNYIYMRTLAHWPGSSVNARLPSVRVGQDDKGNPIKIKPAAWLDEHRRVEVQTWMPGKPTLIKGHEFTVGDGLKPHADSNTFNLYCPPTIKLGDPAGAGFWLDLVDELYPYDKEHIIACFAHARQKPHIKINHALILGGDQGIGKDTIIAGLERAVGFSNYNVITPHQIINPDFNSELKTVVLYISEVHDLGISDRIKFYNMMKDKLATPPTTIRINEKNRQPYYIPNLLFPVMTTNFQTGGIYLPPDDRRHYAAWSTVKKGNHPEKWWQRYYEWFDGGGDRCVAAYLQAYDLSKFNPKAEPLKTEAWHAMVNASRSSEEMELSDILDAFNGGAATMIMIGNEAVRLGYRELAEWLGEARNHKATASRLEDAGYTVIRNPDDSRGRWRVLQLDSKTRPRVIYGPSRLSTNVRLQLARKLKDEAEPEKVF